MWIYDKKKDLIKANPRPPKSIFWEPNRNTVPLNNSETSSFIEDEFFKYLDNFLAPTIRDFQEKEINKSLLSVENLSLFQFFIINLFWRLPYTDYAWEDLVQRAEISTDKIDPEVLRNNEAFQKWQRSGIFKHVIDQLGEGKRPGPDFFVKVLEFDFDLFVLSDNPILFQRTPIEFTDLNYLDYMIPVSSERLYIHTLNGYDNFRKKQGFDYNATIINQSLNYVASGNKLLLENSVEYYRKLKAAGIIRYTEMKLFEK